MVFDKERHELVELFKTKHLVVLNDFTEINDLIENDLKEIKLLSVALTNPKYFLSRPRYFYAIIDFIATQYSIQEFNLVKCNELKLTFEIIRTICFYLIKASNNAYFREYSRIRKSSQTIELLFELLNIDLIEVIFNEIGYEYDPLCDSYVYSNSNNDANRKQLLVEMAFDAYLNYYFFDNIVNFIQIYLNYKYKETCEPLKIVETLFDNEHLNHCKYDKIYNELKKKGYLRSVVVEEEKKKRDRQKQEEDAIIVARNETKREQQSIKDKNDSFRSGGTLFTILTNEQWPCAGCTYLNEPDKTTCALCFTAKNTPNTTFL